MQKSIFYGLIVLCLGWLNPSVSAQVTYPLADPCQILVYLPPSFTQAQINTFKVFVGFVQQIDSTPITKVRLWKVNKCIMPMPTTENGSTIIGVRDYTCGTGQPCNGTIRIKCDVNYKTNDNYIEPSGQSAGFNMSVNGGDMPMNIGFMDTGVGGTTTTTTIKGTKTTTMNIAQPLLIPFYPNRLKGYNYVSNTPFPIDDNSHGTHVTGIAAQVIKLGQSKGTQFQSYKAMDSYGVGSLWTICQAVDKAMQDGVQVLNMSLGFQAPKGISPTAQRSPILEYIFNVAKEHNMLITVAAGNDGANIDLSENKTWYLPANLSVINDNLITVAATTCDGRLAPFSNYGNQSVQVAAPGVNILSTLSGIPTNSNPLMGCKSGTSMATPYVTGLAALFGSQSGQWNYWATKKRILAKASPNQTLRGFLLGEGGVLTTSCDNIRSIAPSNTGGTTTKTTLAVAPNPMTDKTDILFFAPNNDGAELTVCDLFGRVIDRQNVPTTEGGNDFQWTAPSNLPKGIYNVTIKVGDEIHSTRLSKF